MIRDVLPLPDGPQMAIFSPGAMFKLKLSNVTGPCNLCFELVIALYKETRHLRIGRLDILKLNGTSRWPIRRWQDITARLKRRILHKLLDTSNGADRGFQHGPGADALCKIAIKLQNQDQSYTNGTSANIMRPYRRQRNYNDS